MEGEGGVFTAKYKCKYLMYYEEAPIIVEAITREKQLKNWHREWKLNLIKTINPEFKDLMTEIV
jgi:putative endonuclease